MNYKNILFWGFFGIHCMQFAGDHLGMNVELLSDSEESDDSSQDDNPTFAFMNRYLDLKSDLEQIRKDSMIMCWVDLVLSCQHGRVRRNVVSQNDPLVLEYIQELDQRTPVQSKVNLWRKEIGMQHHL